MFMYCISIMHLLHRKKEKERHDENDDIFVFREAEKCHDEYDEKNHVFTL